MFFDVIAKNNARVYPIKTKIPAGPSKDRQEKPETKKGKSRNDRECVRIEKESTRSALRLSGEQGRRRDCSPKHLRT